jgi:D-alanine-D-alanine ligase
MSRIRVGILFGGKSAEHEVSILSARNVLAALDRSRFEPVLIGIDHDGRWLLQPERLLIEAVKDPRCVHLDAKAAAVALEPCRDGRAELVPTGDSDAQGPGPIDVVFPVLHGPMGEDGTMQGLLELTDVAYVGAGVLGSAVGMDKDVMKRLLRDGGVPVASFRTLRKHEFERDRVGTCARAAELGFPLFTKPANLGSSIGIRKVPGPDALEAALAHAFEFDIKALAEEAVVGREVECSVLGNEEPIASLPGEIAVDHRDGFYSYDAKYVDESGARLQIPARLDAAATRAVQELAIKAFRVLECRGLARVDFFYTPEGRLLVNEINTLPGFTAISMYPKMWEATGVGQTELISRLIDLALDHKSRTRRLKTRVEF